MPTASGDDHGYSARFEAAFDGRVHTSVLSLFSRDPWGYTDLSWARTLEAARVT